MKTHLKWKSFIFICIIGLFVGCSPTQKEEPLVETEKTTGVIVHIDGKDVTITREVMDPDKASLEDLIVFHFRTIDEEIVEQLALGDTVTITHTLQFTRSMPPQGQATKIEKH